MVLHTRRPGTCGKGEAVRSSHGGPWGRQARAWVYSCSRPTLSYHVVGTPTAVISSTNGRVVIKYQRW